MTGQEWGRADEDGSVGRAALLSGLVAVRVAVQVPGGGPGVGDDTRKRVEAAIAAL